ncbi:MAG TPA: hypothetical protein VMK65_08480, partial [Longimicrobiales bacterium]|nr:hypothetical protein [Longimicrobiales bacterium]
DGYDSYARAVRLADRAVALDSTLAEARAARGYVLTKANAPASLVEADFRHALRLLPNSADVHGWYAHLLVREGRVAEGLAEARRAIELDPVAPGRRLGYALDALGSRRYDDALDAARWALELEPDLTRPRATAALALILLGRAGECLEMELGQYAALRAICLREAGQARQAETLIDSLAALGRAGGAVSPSHMAAYHAHTGDPGRALEWVERAFARAPDGVDYRMVQSGIFDPVRQDRRLTRRIAELREGVWRRVEREARTP